MSDTPAHGNTATPAPGAANEPTVGAAVVLAKLPPQLKVLVRVMGEGAAFRVIKWLGGTSFTWPKSRRSPQFTQLAEIAGLEAADTAVEHLGGQTWQLPKYDSVLRQLRHARVVELKRVEGLSNPEVALRTGYTVRQVINICNEAGLAQAERDAFMAAQGDLFAGPAGSGAEPVGRAPDAAAPAPSPAATAPGP